MKNMVHRLKIKRLQEKKLIWIRFRHYIDFVILACCAIIAFNIHPSGAAKDENVSLYKPVMIYVFHDYDWNEYIMNDKIHWAPSSWDYLFNDEVPDGVKWDEIEFTDSTSLWGTTNNQESGSVNEESSDSTSLANLINNQDSTSSSDENVKNNQISINDIISDLWSDSQDKDSEIKINENSDTLSISVWESVVKSIETGYYTVEERNWWSEDSSLIIEKVEDNSWNSMADEEENRVENNEGNEESVAKIFTFVKEGWILPTLTSRNDLYFGDSKEIIAYNDNTLGNSNYIENSSNGKTDKEWWITIIDAYADCMTPWWYKIPHWDSVLAYEQMEDTPDICNIERRFCWKWKLSGTYTQQWCSINNDYTYEQRWDIKVEQKVDDWFVWNIRQNADGSVTLKNKGNLWKSIMRKSTYTTFNDSDNIRPEDPEVKQTSRPYWDCTAPWWEKVKHWQFIQAFKHANWFSDAPCEAQIRLCSMWELMWTFSESTCKTRNTSFIDWVNGSPTRKTYSEEKLELVKKQIKAEEKYYKEARKNADRSTNSINLDKILYILDQD